MEKRNVRNWIYDVATLRAAVICAGVIFLAGAAGVVRAQEAPAAPHAPATASPTIRTWHT